KDAPERRRQERPSGERRPGRRGGATEEPAGEGRHRLRRGHVRVLPDRARLDRRDEPLRQPGGDWEWDAGLQSEDTPEAGGLDASLAQLNDGLGARPDGLVAIVWLSS